MVKLARVNCLTRHRQFSPERWDICSSSSMNWLIDWLYQKFNGTKTPKGSHSAKTGESTRNECYGSTVWELHEMLRLPTSQLMSFSSNLLEYRMFMHSFDHMARNTSVSHAAKLNRLQQCCTGKALKSLNVVPWWTQWLAMPKHVLFYSRGLVMTSGSHNPPEDLILFCF